MYGNKYGCIMPISFMIERACRSSAVPGTSEQTMRIRGLAPVVWGFMAAFEDATPDVPILAGVTRHAIFADQLEPFATHHRHQEAACHRPDPHLVVHLVDLETAHG